MLISEISEALVFENKEDSLELAIDTSTVMIVMYAMPCCIE